MSLQSCFCQHINNLSSSFAILINPSNEEFLNEALIIWHAIFYFRALLLHAWKYIPTYFFYFNLNIEI